MCDCELCRRTRYLLDKGVDESVIQDIDCAELERDYLQAIISGSWPSSVEILTNALENALRIRETGSESPTPN